MTGDVKQEYHITVTSLDYSVCEDCGGKQKNKKMLFILKD